MNEKNLLLELLNGVSIPGVDNGIKNSIRNFFSDLDIKLNEYPLLNYGGCLVKAKDGCPTILLEAHMDEVGFIVTSILKGGFVKVENCGGIDRKILNACEVIIHSKSSVYGVVTSIPPHLSSYFKKEKPMEKDIIIDTGLSYEELKKTVKLGDRVSFLNHCTPLLNDRISSKSIDNRASVFSIMLAAKEILKLNPSIGVNVLFSSDEETSMSSTKTGGFTLYSDYAVVVDTTFAQFRGLTDDKYGIIGDGPLIGCAPILDRDLFEKLKIVAEQNTIPYQIEVMNGRTSTNADALVVSKSGIKTSLISIPIRYMHTYVETAQYSDILNTSRLVHHLVYSINKEFQND